GLEPLPRLGVILLDAPAGLVEQSEIEGGVGVALVGGLLIPLRGLGAVLADAEALVVLIADAEGRRGVALVGGLLVPQQGAGMVLFGPAAEIGVVALLPPLLGGGVGLLGRREAPGGGHAGGCVGERQRDEGERERSHEAGRHGSISWAERTGAGA